MRIRPLGPVLILLALCLTACTSGTDNPPTPSTSTVVSGSPSSSPTPELPANTLFVVRAAFTTPNGSTISATETVSTTTAAEAATAKSVIEATGCTPTATTWPADPVYLKIESSVTTTDTDTAELAKIDGMVLHAGDSASTVGPAGFSGNWHLAQAYCADGFLQVPGTAVGYRANATATDWQGGNWGIDAWLDEETATAAALPMTSCTVEFGPAAGTLTAPGWANPTQSAGSCQWGYRFN